jgi:hypothetical protein
MRREIVVMLACASMTGIGGASAAADDVVTQSFREGDPNYSRLLFAPTGRPLKKGDGYFSDYELLFPGGAYGITDNVSIAGGVSVIPGLGLGEQLVYVSPKVGWNLSDRAAVSVGGLFARAGGDGEYDRADSLGIGYAVGTFGGRDRSFSVGLGVGDASGVDGRIPLVMLGGTSTVSRHVALVGETWLWLGEDFDVGQQPIGLGVRFFDHRLSGDVGVILVGDLLEEGFPLPWLSVTYRLGKNGADR